MAKFVDVPEALTCGRDEKEALRLAQEALVLALTEGYMAVRRNVPKPSKPKRGQRTVAVPPWWRPSWRSIRPCLKKG
ncbi:MAG: hypothetical protein M1438_14395 [Deltaproteobacteria bacterium]|nr:hypothetical protein [Deltaproteobacteria bacterium]